MKSGVLRALFPGLSVIYWYKTTIGARWRGREMKWQAKHEGGKINLQMTVAGGREREGSQIVIKSWKYCFRAKGTRTTLHCLLLHGTSFSKYHFGKVYFTMVKPQSNFTTIKIISGPITEFLAWGSMAIQKHELLHVMALLLHWCSLVLELYFFLFAFEPVPPALCTRPTTKRSSLQAKVTFLQRSQGHQNSHFFLATCNFSPGMEKVISFPCTPPYWEQRSSFPLRGKVPLPFFTGWTSANENHYWVHSIYLSGDILADFF